MTSKIFLEKLANTYPDLTEEAGKEIKYWLQGWTEEQIEIIYNLFKKSTKSEYTPKGIAIIEKLAYEYGLRKKSEDDFLHYRKCRICGAQFSQRSRGCPFCRSTNNDMVQCKKYPEQFTRVQDGCWSCRAFERRPQGPRCMEYGKRDNGIIKRSDTSPINECSVCACRFCCAEERLSRAGEKFLLNELSGKSGDVKQVVSDIAKGKS